MLSASPEDGAALTPGPAAVLPLNPQLLQMVGLLTCLCSFCNRRCQELDLMIRHCSGGWPRALILGTCQGANVKRVSIQPAGIHIK